MSIQNIGLRTYSNIDLENLKQTKNNNIVSSKGILSKKDTFELAGNSNKKVPRMGFGIDKGTAAHTTINVNRSTFDKIVNYTTENPECQWDEMGCDGTKRWVVVNGQRFECELSEEEKERIRRGSMTLLDYLQEAEEEEEKHKYEDKKDITSSLNKEESSNDHPKIKGLKQNDKVMKMLNELQKTPGGIKLYL